MVKKDRHQNNLGVSIKKDRLYIVKASDDGNRILLHNYRAAAIAEGIIENGEITGIEGFSQTLQKLTSGMKIAEERLKITIPSSNIVVLVNDVPKLSKMELYQFLQSSIQDHPVISAYNERKKQLKQVQVQTEEIDLYQEDDSGTFYQAFSMADYNELNMKARCFVLSAPYQFINSYTNGMAVLEKPVSLITSDICGVAGFLQLMKPLPEEKSLVLYISDTCSEFIVSGNNNVYFYHRAQISGQSLLQNPLEIYDFFSRAKLAYMSYQDKYPEDNDIDNLIIVSSSNEVAEIINKELDDLKGKINKPVCVLNPMDYVDFDESEVNKESLEKDIFTLVPAIGLCVSEQRGFGLPNFLRTKIFHGPVFTRGDIKPAAITAAVFAVVVILLNIGIGHYKTKLTNENMRLQQEVAALQEQEQLYNATKIDNLKANIAVIDGIASKRFVRTEYLDMLSELLPGDVKLDKLDFKTEAALILFSMEGVAETQYSVTMFTDNLKDEYEDVKAPAVNLTDQGVRFVVTCAKRRI